RLFRARGDELQRVLAAADRLRRETNGDAVTYVVTRNIQYTNVCYFRCGFCAFSKGKLAANLRGEPYLVPHEEIVRRCVEAWARHLVCVREQQRRSGGFTEFVPLPFVHMEAPMYLQGRARRGPTFAEVLLMHAVGRLALHPWIENVQVSWVKAGPEGVKAALNAGVNDVGGTL